MGKLDDLVWKEEFCDWREEGKYKVKAARKDARLTTDHGFS